MNRGETTSTGMQCYHYRRFAIIVFVGCICIAAMIYRYKAKIFTQMELASYKASALTEYAIIANETVTRRPFIYLTQTEKCLPLSLLGLIGDREICNCDVIVLSYQAGCAEVVLSHVTYLFDAQSTWSTVRNALYVTAMKKKNKVPLLYISRR